MRDAVVVTYADSLQHLQVNRAKLTRNREVVNAGAASAGFQSVLNIYQTSKSYREINAHSAIGASLA